MSPFDEKQLRAARSNVVAEVRRLDGERARHLFAGEWKKLHEVLAHGGLRDLPREPEEEALAASVREELARSGGAAPGLILAAMVLLHTHELALPAELDAIPDWLLVEYCRFLMAPPRLFQQPGDAERHGVFVDRATALLHRYVMREPPAPRAAEVREAFVRTTNLLQLYFNELNLRDIYRRRAEIMEAWLFSCGAVLARAFPPRPGGAQRIRVGVLCDHLYAHTETYFMLAHLERFPRERCELRFYVLRETGDAMERHAKSVADATVLLPANDAEAVERLRAEALDVLIIGSNVTIDASRCAVIACHRMAPVQVVSGSSPVTSGMTSADWYLSAEYNESEEGARTQFTEHVYRMPGMITRYAYYHDKDPATLTPSREEFGIPEGDTVFFSGANFFKIIPDLSAQWARVLGQVPEAWLMLIPFNQNWSGYLAEPFCARVLEQINDAGGDPSRVVILDPVPARADLHRVMSLADVYLDSFPFAGACSLLDPLLVGMPVVALAGRTFRGHVGAGMLRGLGLADMALPDPDAYVARAVAFARDPALREQASARIRAALSPKNPVYDSETASRNLEAAVVDMVERAEALDAALAQQTPEALREAIVRLAANLARGRNTWFRRLSDIELIRLLVVPYFQSLPTPAEPLRLVDVGACVGQTAEPFLALGWKGELLEPDPACQGALAALAARHGGRARIHQAAVSDSEGGSLSFYKSAVGLSGLSPSPFGATEATLSVPATRLDRFCREQGLARLDFLKIDAEGWDFDALRSHDLRSLAPRVAMVEYGTEFPRQSAQTLAEALAHMRGCGYEPLFFSYEDHGNFKRRIWEYDLIAVGFEGPVPRQDGHVGGNILFHRPDDAAFLATLLRLLLGFLSPSEREPYLPRASRPTR